MEVEPPGQPFPAPVFIVGCMRSGTTFLVDKLTQHPQLLKVGSELREVWTRLGQAPCEGVCAYRDERYFSVEAANNMTHYFSQYMRDARKLRRHAMRAKARLGKGQGAIFYDWKRVHPVNKSTQLVNKIAYIHALFPRAKIIFIIRSAYGQCSSMKSFIEHHYRQDGYIHYFPPEEGYSWTRIPEQEKTPDMQAGHIYPGNFSLIPRMWLRLNAVAFRQLQNLPEHSFRVVAYEDTVQQQASLLKQLFDFLELDPRHAARAERIAASVLSYKNTTTQGDPLQKWKKYLSEEEVAEIDRVLQAQAGEHEFILNSLEKWRIRP